MPIERDEMTREFSDAVTRPLRAKIHKVLADEDLSEGLSLKVLLQTAQDSLLMLTSRGRALQGKSGFLQEKESKERRLMERLIDQVSENKKMYGCDHETIMEGGSSGISEVEFMLLYVTMLEMMMPNWLALKE